MKNLTRKINFTVDQLIKFCKYLVRVFSDVLVAFLYFDICHYLVANISRFLVANIKIWKSHLNIGEANTVHTSLSTSILTNILGKLVSASFVLISRVNVKIYQYVDNTISYQLKLLKAKVKLKTDNSSRI